MMCDDPWVCSCKFVGVNCDHTHPDAGGVMGTVEYNITAVGAKLTELSQVTTGEDETLERLGQAVMIAQAGGITNEVLGVLLHLATARMMTPAVAQRLRDVGIDPCPMDAIVIDWGTTEPVVVDRDGNAVSDMSMMEPGHPNPVDHALRMARGYAALAEHYAAHPPVPPVSDDDVQAALAARDAEVERARETSAEGWSLAHAQTFRADMLARDYRGVAATVARVEALCDEWEAGQAANFAARERREPFPFKGFRPADIRAALDPTEGVR